MFCDIVNAGEDGGSNPLAPTVDLIHTQKCEV